MLLGCFDFQAFRGLDGFVVAGPGCRWGWSGHEEDSGVDGVVAAELQAFDVAGRCVINLGWS